MKKVYWDIGMNKLSGFRALSKEWGVDDSWHKVFVEPNPEILQHSDVMDEVRGMPGARFVEGAMCCGCSRKMSLSVEEGVEMDWGATLFKTDGVHHQVNAESPRKLVEVDTVSFDDLAGEYEDFEWWIKFDCEGCEYTCLIPVMEKWGEKIKAIACEWHGGARFDGWQEYEERVRAMAREKNIQFLIWG